MPVDPFTEVSHNWFNFLDMINDYLPKLVNTFKAGRLKYHSNAWKEITTDRSILNTVEFGIKIEFDYFPSQYSVPRQYKFSELEHSAIKDEIKSLLSKDVLKIVEHTKGEFISNIFTRPKPDGKIRMILNLQGLNEAVTYHHFKMSTLQSAINLLTKDCFMSTIDWKDAYYCVAISEQHKKLLRFKFDDVLYEFQALPNGLASGPRIFTKITKPVFAHLRRLGWENSPYIDDVLVLGQTREECRENVIQTVEISNTLGFVGHPIKSKFEPSQIREFLGFILNSISMTVRVNSKQANKIHKACVDLKNNPNTTILTLAKVVGLLVASCPGVEYGPIYYRRLDNFKTSALKKNCGNFKAKILIDENCIEDLNWWINNIHIAFKYISHGNHTVVMTTDSSTSGWGGMCDGVSTGGAWSKWEKQEHINFLELKAAWLVLQTFAKNLENTHIKLLIDNTTALAYLNKMGGRVNKLNNLTREIWEWCFSKNIWLTAAYIKSAENVEADRESREKQDNLEWKLNSKLFDKLCKIFDKPEIDLFASRLNFQLENYISWKPDPLAIAVDAFTIRWTDKFIYAFPPFSLIAKMLQKIQLDQVEKALIIVPFWPTQPWFSRLTKMLIDCPFLLRRSNEAVVHPVTGEHHPLRTLQLMACLVSTNTSRVKAFHRKLATSFCPHGDKTPKSSIESISTDGFNFVMKGTLVACHQI